MIVELNDKKVDIKSMEIFAKVKDMLNAKMYDKEGNEIYEHDEYVSDFMPGNHFGDYLILNIDIENGNVLNWKKPTEEELFEFMRGDN